MPWIISTTLTVFIPLLVLYWYLGAKLQTALHYRFGWDRRKIKRSMIVILVALNAFPVLFLVSYLVFGRARVPAFSGESLIVDILFAYPFWFGLVITVQSVVLLLCTDVVRYLLWPLFRRDKERWLRGQSMVVLGIVGFLTLYSSIVIIADTWTVRVIKKEVETENRALAGLTLVHISDVQGDGRTTPGRLLDYARVVNEQNPDLILFAGDLVTSGESYIEETADVMGTMNARFAKIAAVGDHDIFSNKQKVLSALRRNGFVIDDDTTVSVNTGDARIAVTLLTYTYRERPDDDDLRNALNGSDGDLRIALVHQPAQSLVEFAEKNRYDLFLAGHTHGGGVAFGIPGLFLLAPASFESPYVSGFYKVGDMLVSVTNGIGMTLAPIRFHAPAEITVLNFVEKSS